MDKELLERGVEVHGKIKSLREQISLIEIFLEKTSKRDVTLVYTEFYAFIDGESRAGANLKMEFHPSILEALVDQLNRLKEELKEQERYFEEL